MGESSVGHTRARRETWKERQNDNRDREVRGVPRRERPKRRGKERGYVQTTTGEIPAGGSAPRSTDSSRPFLRSPRPISDDSTTMIREDRLGGTGVLASLNLRRPFRRRVCRNTSRMTIASVYLESFLAGFLRTRGTNTRTG